MKKFIILLAATALFTVTSCEKKENPKGVFKAKLVASFCAFNIVEIQDSSFYHLGMKWTATNGTVYKNVFAVSNFCDFGKSGVKVNDVFNCRIIEKPKEENCGVCLGYMDTPPLNRNIEVVKKTD